MNESSLLRAALEPKSDQLNADDLIAGSIDVVIRKVTVAASGEQRIAFYYHGDNNKPYKLGKSMGRVVMEAWGDEPQKYIGRGLRLYRDPEVKMKGEKVGGIRISHMTDISEAMSIPITTKRGERKPWIVKPLVIKAHQQEEPVEYDVAKAQAEGRSEAANGIAALQAWWGKQKGFHGKLGGEPFLNELKDIASKPSLVLPDEQLPKHDMGSGRYENPSEEAPTSASNEEIPFDV